MSATFTEKTNGQKKEENAFDTLEQAIQAAKMEQEAPPELIPENDDWHTIITDRRIGRYRIDVGFYTGEFWTLGNTKPEHPVRIYAWDQAVRIRSSRGKPIDMECAISMGEAILGQWRKDYIAALSAYRRNPTKEHRQVVEHLERLCPAWLLPSTTAEEIIRRIRKDTGYEIPEQTGRGCSQPKTQEKGGAKRCQRSKRCLSI